VLWEQRLGRRLLLDHPDHHPASVLLRRLGRQQLRLWLRLQQRLRLWVQRRLLLILFWKEKDQKNFHIAAGALQP